MSGLGWCSVLRAVVVVVALAEGLALAHPAAKDLKAFADKIRREEAMKEARSVHWGYNLTTTEIIEAMGYPTETHHVTTSDGYILELHRIPHGINGSSPDRPVALLQHCLLCSSSVYIMNTPDQALAYVLADAGYDVWLSNFRGNLYSRAHVELDPDHIDFWRFSWHQMAVYDAPANIDYILATTGRQDLYYVGYSMGTTAFWAMMSELPAYNSKVRAMAALAPVAYMEYTQGFMADMALVWAEVDAIATAAGVGELLPWKEAWAKQVLMLCDNEAASAQICYDLLAYMGGPGDQETNKELLPVCLAQNIAGTSYHTFNHYAQVMKSGKFQQYDYGLLGNLNHYGQDTPPPYNLANVNTSVALFWGQTDWVAAPADVARLASELPNLALNHRVDIDEFNHMHFTWSIHPYEYVNRHVVDFFAKF